MDAASRRAAPTVCPRFLARLFDAEAMRRKRRRNAKRRSRQIRCR
ncbi:hypothetical protein HMPREF0972_01498 [Actinomyces sp. oral taxon 848 str. F0332]|nr:hypothetical protein HMPREF0972_01498 [Actinomyces sp. oral taxon 848 str. F0332]